MVIDTTSTYLYRTEETALRWRGYSRDRRSDLPQVVLCVAVDRHRWPVAWDILPGSTGDIPAFTALLERLRERFRLGRIIVVADRGMVSAQTLALLETHPTAPFDFIEGCKLRKQKEISEDVLAAPVATGRSPTTWRSRRSWSTTAGTSSAATPVEAKKDAAARERIVAKLEAALTHGPKAVLGNRGFGRFARVQKGAVRLDPAALERDARLDGKCVLRTNTALDPADVARAYKSLWRVERTFRETKSTLEVGPGPPTWARSPAPARPASTSCTRSTRRIRSVRSAAGRSRRCRARPRTRTRWTSSSGGSSSSGISARSTAVRATEASPLPRARCGSPRGPTSAASGTKRGTEVAALFYSLIESAKLCGVEPKAYLLRAVRAALTTPGAATLPHALLTN